MRANQSGNKLMTDAEITQQADIVRSKNLNEIRCDILPNKGS